MVHQGMEVVVPEKNTQKHIYDQFPWEFPLKLGDCSDICKECGALNWTGERNRTDLTKKTSKHMICFQQGEIHLPHDRVSKMNLHPFLLEMFFSGSEIKCANVDHSLLLNEITDLIPTGGKAIHANSWAYDNSLSFTSLGVHFDESAQGSGPYCFRVRGELHHNIGSIFPINEDDARFAQIFFVGDGK
ncbi:hypothetical protein O181_114790 [Austropuccinia psidii MF-1]|uniref:Uncharacterized protein n=1 Tax=Austropuccinia psidii MF-1 TaxID=1389203 RepID=A0A9Q3PVU4_9BASI|nr:hypothetical protein [Austropuccinia psidii MF-1]